jgi:hypothetical protein
MGPIHLTRVLLRFACQMGPILFWELPSTALILLSRRLTRGQQ